MKKTIKIPDKCEVCQFLIPRIAFGFHICALYDYPISKRESSGKPKPPWCVTKEIEIEVSDE